MTTQYLSYLLHRSELTDANAAHLILGVGRKHFNAKTESLSGADLNRWLRGDRNLPRWAILASFSVALDHGYKPEQIAHWPDFIRSWCAVFKPGNVELLLEQMQQKGVIAETITDELKVLISTNFVVY